MMASVSQTEKSSSSSTGTLPAGEKRATSLRKAECGVKSKRSFTSSNGMPSCFISTQGRIDQDE